MKVAIIAVTIAVALAAYWIEDNAGCLWSDDTDSCVGCTDDCLDNE